MSYTEFKCKEVVCRKPHKCEWCGESVDKKSTAIYRVYLWEGDFNSEHMHLECNEAMNKSADDIIDGFEPQSMDRGKTLIESSNYI